MSQTSYTVDALTRNILVNVDGASVHHYGVPAMSVKRISRTVAALLAVMFFAVACTSDEGATGEEAATSGDSTLADVLEEGTVRVAVLPDFPPFSVQNADGEFEGYEVDIAHELAEALGVELELVSTDGSSRLPLLNADRADVNISSWTATDERAQAVGFTTPYIADGASVLYRSDNPIESYEDLEGRSVSVARGSTNDIIMTEDFPDTEIVRFETIADAVQALASGQVDAAIEGRATVMAEAAGNDDYEQLDEPPLRPSLISMGVLPDDQQWLNFLNNFVRNLNSSGRNAEIYDEWFGDELPSVVPYQP